MKNVLCIIAFMLIVFSSQAQEKKATSENKELSPEQKALEESYRRAAVKYQTALRYNDYAVAKDAIYEMLVINPRGVNVLDTLALMYFDNNQYTSALLVAKDAISINKNNETMLEISALSYESLGLRTEALSQYESLYLQTDDPGILFKMAILQFDLKRYNECKTSLEIVLESKGIDTGEVTFPANNENFSINFKGGAYYVLGLVHQQKGRKEEAKEAFEKALEVDQAFLPAAEKLKALGQ